ncbi:hypothetical protein BDN72DRAFT_797616 [Pluteus cervinus]|uniref:Uncharacterized protein n=1 Tax=Pluteus cervinus TaxID=181527 RepID=A0ACD3ASK4_9AGAR|nr:hypothetical protein BDN72DRAFT_797616 [Pluteus cervinus]
MSDSRRPIEEKPPRWNPNSDPASIAVPGLDTTASVHDQIEQIEQLITIKLQNVDENFSKIHNVLATKLLPAVKRYAVGTDPVREAAKFWTSFYEKAAQIRIPTYDDYETVNDVPSEREATISSIPDSHDRTATLHTPQEPSILTSESSFMPGQAAFSSTPAAARTAQMNATFQTEGSDPSWNTSLESPLVRLEREVQSLSTTDDTPASSAAFGQSSSSTSGYDEPTPQPNRTTQRKGKEKANQSLLHNVLRHNLYSASDTSSSFSNHSISPQKPKVKTPVPKKLNPYLPRDTTPEKWDGLVDLRNTPLSTNKSRRSDKQPSTSKPTSRPFADSDSDSDDDSFHFKPASLASMKLVSPAKPSRDQGLGRLGKTPVREASARITRDLVKDFQLQGNPFPKPSSVFSSMTSESSMSSVAPTPPLLYKFSSEESITIDSSLDSMIRRVGLTAPTVRPPLSSGVGSTPALQIRRRSVGLNRLANTNPSPAKLLFQPRLNDEDEIQDYHSDSDSSMDDTVQGGFLMPQGQVIREDDSFGSSNQSSDSLEEEDRLANAFAAGDPPPIPDAAFDDTMDDDELERFAATGTEETVFGVPPAQRMQMMRAYDQRMQMMRAYDQRNLHPNQLRMLGEDLLEDTIGIGAQIAATGRVEESPTPAGWPPGGR